MLTAPPAPSGQGYDRRGHALLRDHALFRLSLLALAVLYGAAASTLSRPHAFWSPDVGAQFAMIQGGLRGDGVAHLAYANVVTDPEGQIHPLAFYLAHGPRGLFIIYPPLYPWLSQGAYRLLGFPGLSLLSALCGLGTAWATGLAARRLGLRYWSWLPLVMGLATPLLVYSVVFWTHAALMLLAALAAGGMARALREGRARWAVGAGAALGLGVCVHELLGMLLLAALAAALTLPRTARARRLAGALLAGAAPLLLGWLLANRWLYGLWAGPHLAGNVANPRDHFYGWATLLGPVYLRGRVFSQLVGVETLTVPVALFGLLLAAGVLAARRGGACRWAAVPLWAGAALAGLPLLWGAGSFSGLFPATPLLLLALTPGPRPSPPAARGHVTPPPEIGDPMQIGDPMPAALFFTWARRACALFVLMVLLNPVPPGLEWGGRYLLTALPLLVLLAAGALERLHALAPQGPRRRAVLAGAATLVAASLAGQVQGLAAVHRDLAFSRDLIGAARAAPGPALVTDLTWVGPELMASPVPLPEQYLVRSGEDRLLLLDTLRTRRLSGLTYMGSFEGLDLLARAVSHADPPLFMADKWEGAGLRLARFAPRVGALKSRTAHARAVQAKPAPKAAPLAAPGTAHRVLAMYYPWYGTPQGPTGRWAHQEAPDAAHKSMPTHTHFPASGPYDSADPKVVDRHLDEAKAAGIDTLVCSWWGPKDPTDAATRLVLRRAPAHGLTACVYWEHPAKLGDPKATAEDLSYLLNTLGKAPGYLRVGGRPVVFLYAEICQSLTPEQWATVLTDARRHTPPGVFAVGDGLTPADLLLWDGWHSLNTSGLLAGPDGKADARASAQARLFAAPIALARRLHGLSVETVLPGYDDRGPNKSAGRAGGLLLDRQDGTLYRALWEQAIADGPDWILINSFNEWHNGTEIEPSVEMGDKYLTLTRQEADRFRGTTPRKPVGP